jgi:hypothetical protein
VLARLFKGAQWGPEPAPPAVAPNLAASLSVLTPVPEARPQPLPQTGVPKRRRKRIEIEHIYPTQKPRCEALDHATGVLHLIKAECTAGKFIPKSELERMYWEMCEQQAWDPRHWTAIARHLGKMTERATKKEAGRKFTAYRVPKL